MIKSLKRELKAGYQDYNESDMYASRGEWVRENLSQIVATVGHIMWCA
jgi:hypothetical protein